MFHSLKIERVRRRQRKCDNKVCVRLPFPQPIFCQFHIHSKRNPFFFCCCCSLIRFLFSSKPLHPPYRTRFSTHFMTFSHFSFACFVFYRIRNCECALNSHKTWKLWFVLCKRNTVFFFHFEFNIIRFQLHLSFEICCSVGVGFDFSYRCVRSMLIWLLLPVLELFSFAVS